MTSKLKTKMAAKSALKPKPKHHYKIGYILGYYNKTTMECFYFKANSGWLKECKDATIYKTSELAEAKRRQKSGRHNKKQMFITKCYYEITEVVYTRTDIWGYNRSSYNKKTEKFKQLTRVNPLQAYDSLMHKI